MLLKFQDCLSYTLEKFKATKAKGLLVCIDDSKESLGLVRKYKGKVTLKDNPSLEIIDFANGASISGRSTLSIVHSNNKHDEIISKILNLSKTLDEPSFKHICISIDNEFASLDVTKIDNTSKHYVFLPSNPYDFCSFLSNAIESDFPSFFLISPDLYEVQGPVPNFSLDKNEADPLSEISAKIRKEANDITLISTGEDIFESCDYAKELLLDAEIIETRVISPIDYKTLKSSIEKTKYAKIIQTNNYLNDFNKSLCSKLKAMCKDSNITIEKISIKE